jgi:hypothetical protein
VHANWQMLRDETGRPIGYILPGKAVYSRWQGFLGFLSWVNPDGGLRFSAYCEIPK